MMFAPPEQILSRRVQQAESLFLNSLCDREPLLSFTAPWSTLTSDLLGSLNTLDTETRKAAYRTASRVATVTEALSEVYTKIDALDLSLDSEVGNILDSVHPRPSKAESHTERPGRACLSVKQRTLTPDAHSPDKSLTKSPVGPHCNWLFKNLRNPFPSAPVKKELAKALDITVKTLDDWFSNARRKIGWGAFSKRHFKGNRSLTLDCAHHVWVEGKKEMYSEEVIRDLEEVKATAERLYGSSKEDSVQESSCFAREIGSLETEMAAAAANKLRKRRLSTCSSASERTIVSSPSSDILSRKRARDISDDSDATCCSEVEELSTRPFKRARSTSSAYSFASQESLSPTYSSYSSDTVSEVSTPAMSPTHPHLPIEIVDGWIDGLSAASPFLPHDAAYKPRESVLSHKRPSPDSDSDVNTDNDTGPPSKRARLDTSPSPPSIGNCDTPDPGSSHSQSAATALAECAPPSPTHTPTQASVGLSPTNEATTASFETTPAQHIAATATETEEVDLDLESAKAILSELDYSIPQPPFWDDDLLGNALDMTLSSLGIEQMGSSSSSSGLPDDIDALWAKALVPDTEFPVPKGELVEPAVGQECAGAIVEAPGSSYLDPFADHSGSIPFSLSTLDFDFLESLGDAFSDPLLGGDVPSTDADQGSEQLIDITPILELGKPTFHDPDRMEKFERIEQLLAEAQKLQQEVFG